MRLRLELISAQIVSQSHLLSSFERPSRHTSVVCLSECCHDDQPGEWTLLYHRPCADNVTISMSTESILFQFSIITLMLPYALPL